MEKPSNNNPTKIAVLGWGSLIWDSRNLKIKNKWKKDGPSLPIEFARISNGGRLTLVIFEGFPSVQVLWNYMDFDDLTNAINNLKEREGTQNKDNIGYINFLQETIHSNNDNISLIIRDWAKTKQIDAILWSDFQGNFEDKIGDKFTLDNIVKYLDGLTGKSKIEAQNYIVNAPKQIQTKFRNDIQKNLGWY